MKAGKKLFALLLAVMLLVSVLPIAAASGATETDDKGSITISNPIDGVNYYAYKIFDVTYSLSDTSSAYSYTISEDSAWWNTILTYMGGGTTTATAGTGGVYTGKGITLTPAAADDKTYVVTVTTGSTEADANFNAADFAAALGKAVTNTNGTLSPDPDATLNSDGDYTASGLDLGYYFVYSSGYADGTEALFSLDTTNPTATIRDKNQLPTIAKEVSNSNEADATYGEKTTASIGDKVYFQVTITTEAGQDADGLEVAQDYVLHDTMSDGLTVNADSVTVVWKTTKDGTETDKTLTAWSEGSSSWDYKVASPGEEAETADKCSFEITFSETFLKDLNAYDTLVITYTATVNKEAATADDNSDGKTWTETNSATLSYKKDDKAAQLEAKTTTVDLYSFDLIKTGPAVTGDGVTGDYQTTDADNNTKNFNTLTGATFKLYSDENCDNEVKLVAVYEKDGNGADTTTVDYYRPAVDGETAVEGIEAGKVEIRGLAAGTYYLKETAAPAGYNPLTSNVPVALTTDDGGTSLLFSAAVEGETSPITGGVQVENSTGNELPSTGGIGTTIFYVVGSILVVGAAILLITKRRMNGERD